MVAILRVIRVTVIETHRIILETVVDVSIIFCQCCLIQGIKGKTEIAAVHLVRTYICIPILTYGSEIWHISISLSRKSIVLMYYGIILSERYSIGAESSGGSRKKYLGGGAGPSSFGRQQRISEITTESINSTSSRTTVSIVQFFSKQVM